MKIWVERRRLIVKGYNEIYDGKEVYIPEGAINGQISFCVFVPVEDTGLVYKFTVRKNNELSWEDLESVANVFGGSTEHSSFSRRHAFGKAWHAWKSWKDWKRSLPEKQLAISQKSKVRLPYKDDGAT